MKRPQHKLLLTLVVILAALCLLVSGLLSHFYPQSKFDLFRSEFRPTDWQKTDDVDRDGVRLQVVDEQGQPVVGAVVGDFLWGSFSSTNELSSEMREEKYKARRIDISECEHGLLHFISRSPVLESTEEGIIEVPQGALIAANRDWPPERPHVLYVVHPALETGALARYQSSDMGSMAQLTLLPLCHVHGTIKRADGEPFQIANVVAFWGPMRPWWMAASKQEGRRINMLLPPGQYRIWCAVVERNTQGGRTTTYAAKNINIEKGMKDLELNMILKHTKDSN